VNGIIRKLVEDIFIELPYLVIP